MASRRIATATLAFGLVLTCAGTARAQQQDHATPLEVVQKVRQAGFTHEKPWVELDERL